MEKEEHKTKSEGFHTPKHNYKPKPYWTFISFHVAMAFANGKSSNV
jgi:hypothetical protein